MEPDPVWGLGLIWNPVSDSKNLCSQTQNDIGSAADLGLGPYLSLT